MSLSSFGARASLHAAMLFLSMPGCRSPDVQCGPRGTKAVTEETTTIVLAPTIASVIPEFQAEANGLGDARIGAFDFSGIQGSIEVDGERYASIIYEGASFNEMMVVSVLGVGTTLIAAWLYCREGRAETVYFESPGHPLTYEIVTGTCSFERRTDAGGSPSVDITLPGLFLSFGSSFLDPTIVLSGKLLRYDGRVAGQLSLPQDEWVVLPMETVDCRSCSPDRGWREIHALFWREKDHQLCFAALYLFDGLSDITLGWPACVPAVGQAGKLMLPRTISAEWSVCGSE